MYFSGDKMSNEFAVLESDDGEAPPFPRGRRRPDWRSSRREAAHAATTGQGADTTRWGSKIAVAVDRPFFDALGGPSPQPNRDLGSGDVIWLVSEAHDGQLSRRHWEILTLERTCEKLLAANEVTRSEFERTLRDKLVPIDDLEGSSMTAPEQSPQRGGGPFGGSNEDVSSRSHSVNEQLAPSHPCGGPCLEPPRFITTGAGKKEDIHVCPCTVPGEIRKRLSKEEEEVNSSNMASERGTIATRVNRETTDEG